MVESNQTQQMVKDFQPQTLFVFVWSEQLMKRFLLCFSSSENHRSRPREAEEQKIEYIVTLHAWTGVLSCCSFINSAAAWKCVTEIQWKERGFFFYDSSSHDQPGLLSTCLKYSVPSAAPEFFFLWGVADDESPCFLLNQVYLAVICSL